MQPEPVRKESSRDSLNCSTGRGETFRLGFFGFLGFAAAEAAFLLFGFGSAELLDRAALGLRADCFASPIAALLTKCHPTCSPQVEHVACFHP